jgi:hypothetical protein
MRSGADYAIGRCLVAAEIRERLSVSKQAAESLIWKDAISRKLDDVGI